MTEKQTKQDVVNLPVPADTTRVCSICGQEKPLANFHNGRGTVCNSCHRMTPERQEGVRIASQLKPAMEAFEKKIRQFIAHQRGDAYKAPHLMELYAEMTHVLGGARAWAELWRSQLNLAMLKNAGSKTVLDALRWYADLGQAALAMRETTAEVSQLSDQELRTAVLAELFVEMPQFFESLKLERPDIAMELVDAGFDPKTGVMRQSDERFDDDATGDDMSAMDVMNDSQLDPDDAEEAEFTTYEEASHA